MSKAEEKLKKLASKEQSKWVEKARWRIANEKWLDKSAKIALTILRTIRKKSLSQKDLADKLNISPQQVNKILKGQENLTLETISKIEVVLGISLIEVPSLNIVFKPSTLSLYMHNNIYAMGISAGLKSYDEMKESIECQVDNENQYNRKTA